jgi:hypothetical protein
MSQYLEIDISREDYMHWNIYEFKNYVRARTP